MKETTTLQLTAKQAAFLENELRAFLRNRISQFEKYKLSQNLKQLEKLNEAYREANDELFTKYGEANAQGQRHVPDFVLVGGKWVDNDNFRRFKEESKRLDEDLLPEQSLRTIPVKLLKEISEDTGNYEHLYQFLVVETPGETTT